MGVWQMPFVHVLGEQHSPLVAQDCPATLQLTAQAPFTQLMPLQQLRLLVQAWPWNPQLIWAQV